MTTWPQIWAAMHNEAKAAGLLRQEHGLCRVYWRTHGCCLPRHHDGPCECDCGEPPIADELYYGDDVKTRGLPHIDP